MMAPTHVTAGPVLALPVLILAPELAVVAALSAAIGGLVPDLDVLVGEHRKTLHHPVGYWVPAIPAVLLASISPSVTTVAAAFLLVGAAVHSVLDWFGGDDGLEAWKQVSDRGVYLHQGQRWLRPKRWVRYDGSPEDVAFAFILAIPGLFLYTGVVRLVVGATLVVAVSYGLVRKRVPQYVKPIVK